MKSGNNNIFTRLFNSLFTNQTGDTIMPTSKAPNYSDEAIARLEAVYTEAQTDEQRKNAVAILAEELGKTKASIIAKLSNMKIYVKATQAPKAKVDRGPTKAQLAGEIAERLNITNDVLIEGIAKADKRALQAILKAV